jgi:hypothetical protein
MPDILVRHCTLRVVRRSGWSWGPDPQRLVQQVLSALPELVARKLEALWPDDTDVEISAPVRIAIPVRMEELLSVGAGLFDNDLASPDPTVIALNERLEQAIRSTFGREYPAPDETHRTTSPVPDQALNQEQEYPPQVQWGGTVLRLLLSWRDQRVLEQRLAVFSPSALETWHNYLFNAAGEPSTEAADVSSESIEELVTAIAHSLSLPISERATILWGRLLTIVEVVAQLRVPPNHPGVRETLDRVLPLTAGPDVDAPISPTLSLATNLDEKAGPTHAAQSAGPLPPRPLRQTEVHVASALPFLMLGPLSRIGYLETLTATLEATDLLPEITRFATALAYKVLDPPERGWRRLPAATNAAAVFAGVEEPVTEPDLTEFARKVSDHLSPLNAVLAGTLIVGHSPNQPLLLQRANVGKESGLLLTDVEGLFPITWSSELEGLLPNLVRLETAILLIPEATADPALLAKLDARGLHFITDAPPTRHESWRSLRGASAEKWWTNDLDTSPAVLIEQAHNLANATEETESLWQALAVDRPCVRLAVDAALECSLTLAASLALGTIAWELWRERESVVPLLALERFRDLDAHVRFDHRSVRVRLPLGRRYQDLNEHRLLADVHNVPWLGERVLQFSGG